MTQLTRQRRSGRRVARRRPRSLGRRAAAGLAAALASGLSIGSLTVAGGAAAHAGTRRAPAAHSSGMLLAWGNNQQGELGNGSADPDSLTPVSVKLPHGTKVTQFRTASFSIALTTTGKVLTWGYNRYGSLGNGKKDNSSVPVRVKLPRGTKVTAVRAGGGFALALTSTGKVLAWGFNHDGELGNGKTKLSRIPVSVHLPRHTRIKAISAGTTFGYALTTGGRVLAWGYGGEGELGNGKTKGSHIPVGVHLPKGTRVTQVSAGGGHALVLTSAGRVLAWGYGQQGELGNGRTKNRDVPVRVRFPAGW
jgi:alpha-tubulin suppressor-like RCC1 family protein